MAWQGQVRIHYPSALEILKVCGLTCLQQREETLATILVTKMKPFLDAEFGRGGSKEEFTKACKLEARRMGAIPFGLPMMQLIG